MKKLTAIFSGVLAFFVVISIFKQNMDSAIIEKSAGVRDYRSYERFWSSEAQRLCLDENTLPVFGSSELTSLSDYEAGVGSFLNGDDMNIMTIGAGNFQSLSHTMALGAISEGMGNRKIALFLSPQWFSSQGVYSDAFSARFGEDNLLQFLLNNNISDENKEYVLQRTISLLSSSPTQLQRVKRYQGILEKPFSLDHVYTRAMAEFWSYRSEFEVYRDLDKVRSELPYYDLSSIDFQEVLELAENQGVAACTNNSFGIYDKYFDTYVKDAYEAGETIEKNQAYTESPEYDDLVCFLNVASELDLEIILVSIPVNAAWYTYQGDLCDVYYQNIRDLASQYGNITFVDMSVYENEPYFLKDVMHLGWKGWARINEALYTAFIQK